MSGTRYTLWGILAIILWSATVALVRSISEQIGPVTSGAAVYLTGGILACLYVVISRKPIFVKGKFPIRYFLSTGSLFSIYTISLFLAIGLASSRMEAIELGLLNYLWPGLTILLSLVLLSQKSSFWILPGTLLAFAGIFLVITAGTDFSWNGFVTHIKGNPLAYLFGVIAALSWAFYSNLTRLWKGVDESAFVPFFILITGLFLLGLSFVFPEERTFSFGLVIEVLFLSLSTVLAYIFWELAMQKGNLAIVLPFSYMTPLFSTLISTFYLGVIPGARLWIGCLILIAGSLMSWWSLKQKE